MAWSCGCSSGTRRPPTATTAAANSQHLDESYGHDDLSRLDSFLLGDVNTSTLAVTNLGQEQGWSLDTLGNWDAFDRDDDGDGSMELEQTRTANDANEIGTIAATTGTNWVDPTYDAAGNMTKRAAPDAPGTDTSAHLLTYGAWNRVVKITDNAGSPATIATYEYDGLGRRIRKAVGSDTYDYYYNESWQVVEVRLNGDANPLEQFAYDTDYIDAVAMRWYDADTDGDTNENNDGEQYYLRDASFNVIALLEEDGDVLERYRYTPYGERVVLDPDFSADADNTTDYGQQRGFQGLLHDEESGLIENRARMLDPLTGRFMQRGPLGYPDGMNSYTPYHVLGGGVDPWGLCEGHDSQELADQYWEANIEAADEEYRMRTEALILMRRLENNHRADLLRDEESDITSLQDAALIALASRFQQFNSDLDRADTQHRAAAFGALGVDIVGGRMGWKPLQRHPLALAAFQVVNAGALIRRVENIIEDYNNDMAALVASYNLQLSQLEAQYDRQWDQSDARMQAILDALNQISRDVYGELIDNYNRIRNSESACEALEALHVAREDLRNIDKIRDSISGRSRIILEEQRNNVINEIERLQELTDLHSSIEK